MAIKLIANSGNTNGTKFTATKIREMNKILSLFLVLAWSLTLRPLHGQNTPVVPIDSIVDQYLLHQKAPIPSLILEDSELGFVLLSSLERYRISPEPLTRKNSYKVVLKIAYLNSNPKVKEKALEILLFASFDSVPHIRSHFEAAFKGFDREYFSSNFLNNISSLLHNNELVTKEIIRLSGFLGLQHEKGYIKTTFIDNEKHLSSKPLKDSPNTYAAKLALARLGEGMYLEKLISDIEDLPPDEIVVFLEDLAYTQNSKAKDFLLKQLNSSAKISNCGITEPISNRVLHLFAQKLSNFPIKAKKSGIYSEEEINNARDWANAENDKLSFMSNKW